MKWLLLVFIAVISHGVSGDTCDGDDCDTQTVPPPDPLIPTPEDVTDDETTEPPLFTTGASTNAKSYPVGMTCNFVGKRRDCSSQTVTESSCHDLGCCWHQLPEGVDGPWCYFKQMGELRPQPTTSAPITTTVTTTVDKTTQSATVDNISQDSNTTESATATAGPTQANSTGETIQYTTATDDTDNATAASSDADSFTLKVASVLIVPYLMEKKDVNATGNDRYEGFIKDILDELASSMHFQYSLVIHEEYGKKVGGQWTGTIGDVVSKNVAFAAAPLIVTLEREKVVDFTWPLLSFEAVVLMLKRNPDQTPKIENFEDLVNQTDVEYDVAQDSPIAKEMKTSEVEVVKEAWTFIESKKYLHNKNNDKGVQRVRKDPKYAFIIDEITADYVLRGKPCELQVFKAGFFRRMFAIAVPNGDPLRDRLNENIHYIKDSGKARELYEKWWGENECAAGAEAVRMSLVLVFITVFFAKGLGIWTMP